VKVRNHNESASSGGVKVRTAVKAGKGGLLRNHNETASAGVKVRTSVKAGGIRLSNHNEAARRSGPKA
jgi:hypothetical protein